MTWLNNLLRGPAVKSATRQPAGRPTTAPTAPAVDPDAARTALAAAADDAQRSGLAEQLGQALAKLQQAPQPDDGPAVRAAAICHVADKSIALQWMGDLSGDSWLGEVAVQGRFAEVRLAAAQRIDGHEVLEHVAHLSRGKDKGVFKHCSDRLRQRRQAAGRAQRAAQLAADLRELLDRAPLSVSRLLDLEHEWQALSGTGEPPSECRALLDQAGERLRQESEVRRSLQTLCTEAEELSNRCSGAAGCPEGEELQRWRDRLTGLAQARAALPEWLAGKTAAHALDTSLHQIEARVAAVQAERTRADACERFLSELGAGAIDAGTASAWEALPKPDHPELRDRLEARWQALQTPVPAAPVSTAPESPPLPPSQPQFDPAAIHALLEEMEQALEQGHLSSADAAAKRIKSTLGSGSLRGSLASRLQRAQARLGELSGWAKWGAERKREHLIAAADELLAGNHDVDYLARAIPALREEWKQLSGQASSGQREWERFDAALEQAYRPVAERRAQEAARRSEARAAKEALCAEWEATIAALWERGDCAAVEALRQQMPAQWRAAPRAGFRDERILRRRLDALMADTDRRLAALRGTEIERREKLIAAVEALREAPDLRSAISEAKALQERWRNEAGAQKLPRADEQKLWHRFRAGCDAVFARREAERAEQVAQREKRAQERVALLDSFAAALAGSEAGQIKRALAQFRADWAAAKAADSEHDRLEPRARDLQQQAQRRIETLNRDAYRGRLERLSQQAPSPDGVDAATLAAGRDERESLLIDLEIALDLPTPEAFAQARRRRQLEHLQSRFRGAPAQQPHAEELLTRWYAVAASPDQGMDQRVAAVVCRLLEQGQVRRPAAD